MAKVKKTVSDTKKKTATNIIHRFSQPFYTASKIEDRKNITGVGKRMTDYIKTKLEPIPIANGDSVMLLDDIIGKEATDSITNTGSILFHAVGDTGHEQGEAQQAVSDAMSEDYNVNLPEKSPALFIHLGDVIYYKNTDEGYHAQFYEPYKKYPGKIIAIPGNHDGEIFSFKGNTGQAKTLEAFMNNFCLPKPSVPKAAGSIYRQMVNQPGVYWLLKAPFVNIIGLYSNIAEGPGYISDKSIGYDQKNWLTKTLKALKAEKDGGINKALVIATHHPPLSKGGHEGSSEMLQDIDDSCKTAGIMPNLMLAGHAHNYQRFTRAVQFNNAQLKIPIIVAGTGGRGITPISNANGSIIGDHSYDKSLKGYGYLLLQISSNMLKVAFYQVDTNSNTKTLYDNVDISI